MAILNKFILAGALLLFWTALLCCGSAKAQSFSVGDTIQVLMRRVEKSLDKKPVMFITRPGRQLKEEESRQYKGIPASLELYGVFVFDFQPAQMAYEKYLNGQLPKERLPLIKEYYNIDTSSLSKEYVKQEVAVLSAIYENKKLLIYDTNNDKDFSNDPLREFRIDSLDVYDKNLDLLKTVEVSYQYFADNKIHDRVSGVKIVPYSSSYMYGPGDSVMQKLQVYMVSYQENEGSISLGGRDFKMVLPNGQFLGGDYRHSYVMIGESGKAYFEVDPILKIGDTFNLDGIRVKFQSASEFGDTLTLVNLGTNNMMYGYRKGESIHPFSFTDIISNKTVSSKGTKKYILLDFWGVWCAPCIEGLPELKAFHGKYKSSLEIISIAYDDDVEKVKNFVNKRGLQWRHKFENRKLLVADDLVKKLEVGCYPTFILMDVNHEILYRGCGADALKEAEKIVGK